MFIGHNGNTKTYPCQYVSVFDGCNTSTYIPIMNKLRETIDKQMRMRGWNAYDLSDASGVPQPTIHRFLKGDHDDMRTKNVQKLARGLGLTEAQLRGMDDIPEPAPSRVVINPIKLKTVSETERYWLELVDICNKLIDQGLYADSEVSRRRLFWDAFDAMTEYNYPELSEIESMLREKSVKKSEKK